MGRFRSQKKNLLKNKVAVSVTKLKVMKKAARQKKAEKSTDGEDVAMIEEIPVVPGLSVASAKKLAAGELKNVPKVNEQKIFRKTNLPVREKGKVLDAPSGKKSVTAQFITKKKAKKLHKKMTHRVREEFRKLQEAGMELPVDDDAMED
ncbi:unnamed protein product [Caenorhabditis bovis]|uniref:Uncharacterized protein n=1 Tax=Caenorhabditis bovis TaxID=2654633 RepID=A0A8S1EXL8_9PELO|nr:unnamed protein product [Caenorhabditis bovis]